MSALPPNADINELLCHVRFVPKADIHLTRLPRRHAAELIAELKGPVPWRS